MKVAAFFMGLPVAFILAPVAIVHAGVPIVVAVAMGVASGFACGRALLRALNGSPRHRAAR